MQVVEEVVLGHLQGGVHGRGVRGVAQFLEESGAVGEQAEAGEAPPAFSTILRPFSPS